MSLKYRIALIPCDQDKQTLHLLRDVMGKYRYTGKASTSDVHITLAQFVLGDHTIEQYSDIMSNLFSHWQVLSLQHDRCVAHYNKGNEKYPDGRIRGSVLYNNRGSDLGRCAIECIGQHKNMDIDDTDAYINKIKQTKEQSTWTEDVLDYTANHLNICNYALPEFQGAIQSILDTQMPETITYDTIAIRDELGKHIYEWKL